jgi:hypothetical protein
MEHPDDLQPTDDEEIDEALEESFPASDPPSTWSGADHAPRPGVGPSEDPEPPPA